MIERRNKFDKYVEEVRMFLRDLPGITLIPNNPDGTEFSDEEIINALRYAHQLWRNVPMHTPFMPIIPTPEVRMALIKAAAGYVLKLKAIDYSRKAISYGDTIQINDFEIKSSTYMALGEQLIREAEREFALYKNYFINTRGYTI
ncbi:MAG: hypothetical protein ACO2O4_04290 [Minisyncoccia bacterium]